MNPVPLYEDKNFLAVYKPAGVLVHKTATSDKKQETKDNTLVDWLLEHYPEIKNVGDDPQMRPGIVHRLDKDTSGIILIARNQKYFEYLKNLFQNHEIKKTYLALVYGKLEPQKGIIEKPIRLKSGSTKRTVWKGKLEKSAATEYQVLKIYEVEPHEVVSLIRAVPKTGRTHQIRIHLASIHHPVASDPLYGPKTNPLGLNRQFLHAESLEWSAEDGKRIKIECELPKELQEVIDGLKEAK
jgi:23S rRNA pseudouridine1911/1915/1917 synthase